MKIGQAPISDTLQGAYSLIEREQIVFHTVWMAASGQWFGWKKASERSLQRCG
jgi:hypothetical protein